MRLFAGPVEPPAKPPAIQESTGEVRVVIWEEKSGSNMSYFQSGLLRSAVLVFSNAVTKPNRTKIDIDTKCMLVDLAGGDSLPPLSPRDRDKAHSPGMALFLDDAGKLVIHDEMDETKEWLGGINGPETPGGNPPGGPGSRDNPHGGERPTGSERKADLLPGFDDVRRRPGH